MAMCSAGSKVGGMSRRGPPRAHRPVGGIGVWARRRPLSWTGARVAVSHRTFTGRPGPARRGQARPTPHAGTPADLPLRPSCLHRPRSRSSRCHASRLGESQTAASSSDARGHPSRTSLSHQVVVTPHPLALPTTKIARQAIEELAHVVPDGHRHRLKPCTQAVISGLDSEGDPLLVRPRPIEQPDRGTELPHPPHNDLDLAWNTIDHTHPPKDTDTLSPTAPAFPGSVRSPPLIPSPDREPLMTTVAANAEHAPRGRQPCPGGVGGRSPHDRARRWRLVRLPRPPVPRIRHDPAAWFSRSA